MDLFTLTARLGLDSSEYERGIGKARGTFSELGNQINAKAVAMGTMMARSMEKAVNMAIDLGKSAVQNAADVAAEKAQFKATFDGMIGEAEAAFDAIEKETGIFGTRLQKVGTKAFSQFAGAGIKGSEGLKAMEEYTKLAADAAAYYDISLEDADTRLRSFLRGNTEAGDAIGLFTSESQRNSAAMEKYSKKWKDLTEAQKQMLMLDISREIYTQSGAIGQAARESDAWTNVIGNMKEVWRQTSATFGSPIMAVITPKIQEFTEWMKGEGVQLKIEQFALGVADKLNSFFKWVAEPTFPTWEEVKAGAQEKIDSINEGLMNVLNWSLGKLGMPDAATIEEEVKTWWTGQGDNAYERVKSVLIWTFGKWVAPAAEEYSDDVQSWWDATFMPSLTGIAKWTFGELIAPAWVDLMFGVKAWWDNSIKPNLKRLTTWNVGKAQWPSLGEMVASATAWWNSVKGTISSIFKVVISPTYHQPVSQSSIDAAMEKYSDQVDAITGASSRAVGIDYVPHNDYYARLHEGERVMTKAENAAYSAGGMYQPVDYAAIGSAVGGAVREALDGIGLYTDDGTRIADMVTARVSRNIAHSAQSRRFAT